MPSGVIEDLDKHLLLFDDGVTAGQSQTELRSFEELRPTLKQSGVDAYGVQEESENRVGEFEQAKTTVKYSDPTR